MESGVLLGPYKILELLGAGGMGEVYLAQDTRLHRRVAIKLLSTDFASDANRLDRLRREARLLAQVDHPSVATIHGMEEHGDATFLVMEYVRGQTLANRITMARIPVYEALQIALRLTEGLEAAHAKGIIHRDLKPANVMVSEDPAGDPTVKILDFGLAKAYEVGGKTAEISPDLSHSPTNTGMRRTGVVLGTAAYMSPEQVRGKPVDRRSDLWSLGCVMYEMLAGEKAFGGDTLSDLIVGVLGAEPDWRSLPEGLSPRIADLLRRCLTKDVSRRWRDAGDATIILRDALAEPDGDPVPAGLFSPRMATSPPVAQPTARFTIHLPEEEPVEPASASAVAISRDGRRFVYVARRGETTCLVLRELNSLGSQMIAGTEGASAPFFSPDGRFVAFHAAGKLMRVTVSGGPPVPIADAPALRGGSWASDGSILFTGAPGMGLRRVPAEGGMPDLLTHLDADGDERTHRWPFLLPGCDAALFTIRRKADSSFDRARIARLALPSGSIDIILERGTDARYVPTGHLLFVRGGALHAVPYDSRTNRVTGMPVAVVEGLMTNPNSGAAQYAVSDNGTLLYLRGGEWAAQRLLVWAAPGESDRVLSNGRRPYQSPRVSPDGQCVAVMIEGATDDIWIYNLAREALTRLTFEAGSNVAPLWAPSGKELVISSNRFGPYNLYRVPVDRSSAPERLTTSENIQFAGCWSSDGRFLLYVEVDPETGPDIWVLDSESGDTRPLLKEEYVETAPALSPDDRWLAYASDESGKLEVYVQAFPAPGGKWQVSENGGCDPVWSHDGRILYYLSGERLLTVDVAPGHELIHGSAQVVLDASYEPAAFAGVRNFDVTADGRFLFVGREPDPPREIHVVLNWLAELEELVPRGR
jgi:serine/threonine-protein kinase